MYWIAAVYHLDSLLPTRIYHSGFSYYTTAHFSGVRDTNCWRIYWPGQPVDYNCQYLLCPGLYRHICTILQRQSTKPVSWLQITARYRLQQRKPTDIFVVFRINERAQSEQKKDASSHCNIYTTVDTTRTMTNTTHRLTLADLMHTMPSYDTHQAYVHYCSLPAGFDIEYCSTWVKLLVVGHIGSRVHFLDILYMCSFLMLLAAAVFVALPPPPPWGVLHFLLYFTLLLLFYFAVPQCAAWGANLFSCCFSYLQLLCYSPYRNVQQECRLFFFLFFPPLQLLLRGEIGRAPV